jgi:hypothetical protein
MRTKTLVLSAIVGALSSASLMAQVYSLNSVGYINVTLKPGFQIIANQLNTTNNNLSPLLDSQVGDGFHDGLEFFKFNGNSYVTLVTDSLSTPPWDGPATTTTLNPGEAIFVRNGTATNITLTFVGTVLQGSLTNSVLATGFSLVSSMVPQAGAVDSALGLPNVDGAELFQYIPAQGNYVTYVGDSLNSPPWDSPTGLPAAPTVAVGEGFFYKSSGTVTPWVRSFTVN